MRKLLRSRLQPLEPGIKMANVIDIKSRRDQKIHLHKDARADALRGDLRDARQDFQSEDKAKSQTKIQLEI